MYFKTQDISGFKVLTQNKHVTNRALKVDHVDVEKEQQVTHRLITTACFKQRGFSQHKHKCVWFCRHPTLGLIKFKAVETLKGSVMWTTCRRHLVIRTTTYNVICKRDVPTETIYKLMQERHVLRYEFLNSLACLKVPSSYQMERSETQLLHYTIRAQVDPMFFKKVYNGTYDKAYLNNLFT